MKLQRRQFLATFGGILAELAVSRSPAVVHSGQNYINRRMGLAFSVPNGWDFACMEDMGQIQEGTLLDLDDAEENVRALRRMDLPFVAVSPGATCPSEPPRSIQFYLAEPPDTVDVVSMILHEAFGKPYKGHSESTMSPAMQIVCRDRQIARDLLPMCTTIVMPKDLQVSGYSAAEYTAAFEFTHVNQPKSIPVRQRSIAIDHDSRFYLIRLIDTDASPFDFDCFVHSVKLA